MEDNVYSIKAKIKDLANFKDFTSMSMKDTAQKLITDILLLASTEPDEETEDYKLAKEFATEYMTNVTGIANDILITADNDATVNPSRVVLAEPEQPEPLEVTTGEEPSDDEEYEFVEIIDEEDESEEVDDEKEEEDPKAKAKEKLRKFLSSKK